LYRIRLHGRGGHGIKTASRVLGTAFFREGYEVQDAPRYGAERRGAPIFAAVRASHEPIHERGVVAHPDLVVVSDETLVPVAAAGVLVGVGPATALLIASRETPAEWKQRLRWRGPVQTLPPIAEGSAQLRFLGVTCAGAAARLVGVIGRENLAEAVRQELPALAARAVEENLERALGAYDRFEEHAGCVAEGGVRPIVANEDPGWVELPLDVAHRAAPDIHVPATSNRVPTGLWRTMRPVLDRERCHQCTWVCGTFCPDGAIRVGDDGFPEIDYDHCKGCLVCVAVCAPHALDAVPEHTAATGAEEEQ
jgi:pyruvate ferredoxin oxidoreductase gamma subunit